MSSVLNEVSSSPKSILTTTDEMIKQVAEVNQSALSKVLDQLISDRKSWEVEELARSNQRLYSILQSCYVLFQSMNGIKTEQQAIKQAFNKYCISQGWNFKESTHLMVKIVRTIFGDDRRRVSAYAMSLRVAHEKKVPAVDIVTFIQAAGGVEEVRRNKKTADKPKDKAEIGKAVLNAEPLVSITSETLNAKFDVGLYNGAVILLATKEFDGTFTVRRLVQNGAAITAVLASLSSVVTAEEKAMQIAKDAANDEVIRDLAINHAVAA